MKKLIIICLVLIFCSACTNINYRVTIDSNGKLKEDITVLDQNYNHITNDDPFGMDGLSAFEYFFQSLPYNSGYNGSEYYAKKEFSDFDNFLNTSFVFEKFYSYNDISIQGKKIKINLKVNDKIREYMTNHVMNSLEISLYIPYYVSSHNATSVNGNTYTWIIDDIETASIKINFDMGKDKNYMKNVFTVCTIVVVLVIILATIIYLVQKNKKNNEI